MIKNLLLTGASGWFGKSLIYEGYKLFGKQFLNDNFFAASSPKSVSLPGIPEVINFISLEEALNLKSIDCMIQSAFITRDKIKNIGNDKYIMQINNIINTSSKISQIHKLKKHIVISSGSVINDPSLYGSLKAKEEDRLLISSAKDKKILRVYAAGGIFLPKLDWSAISQFVQCFYNNKDIHFKSNGRVLRSLVDFGDLSKILLKYISIEDIYPVMIIDACNTEVDLVEIASIIAKKNNLKVIFPPTFSRQNIASDYRGEIKQFLDLAKFVGQNLSGIDDQIENSLKSFELQKLIK